MGVVGREKLEKISQAAAQEAIGLIRFVRNRIFPFA